MTGGGFGRFIYQYQELTPFRVAGAPAQGGVGLAARVLVLAENPLAVRRTVNPDRDRDAQAILKMPEMLAMLEVLETLDRHGSRTGTVIASRPGLTVFRSGALPVKGLEMVLEKRRLCGDLSPEFALAIQQKTPPDALWTHDPAQGLTTIYRPFAGTNFLELHYVKSLENSAGPLSVRKN